MVVFNDNIMPMAPGWPMSPPYNQVFPPNINSIPFTPNFPPETAIVAPNSFIPLRISTQPGLTLQCSSTHSTPNSSPPPVTCSMVPTNSTFVYTLVTLPYTQTKVPVSQTATTVSSISPCAPALYTPSMPPPSIVPCQQGTLNRTVLQCVPAGPMQVPPPSLYPSGTRTEMPGAVVTNGPTGVYTLRSPMPTMSIAQNVFSTIATSWKQHYDMEKVWENEFNSLFMNYYPHLWTLIPVSQQPNGIWYKNVDSAKVRFSCQKCGHGWTSMKGRVAFWYILNSSSKEGVVCLKLYGQQCEVCRKRACEDAQKGKNPSMKPTYEQAMWYPEEVQKVLVNIYNRVGHAYYGFSSAPYHDSRRPGKPRTQHNSALCQACQDAVCSEKRR